MSSGGKKATDDSKEDRENKIKRQCNGKRENY